MEQAMKQVEDTRKKALFAVANNEDIESICQTIASKYSKQEYMDTGMANRLLLITLMESQLAISSIQQLNNAIERIMELVHNLAPASALDVKGLRQIIKDLPDSMPVMIDYLHGENWTFDDARWETTVIKPKDISNLDPDQKANLVEKGGKYFVSSYTPVVKAFQARISTNREGKRFLCIHAHF